MQYLPWIFVAVFMIIAFLQYTAAKSAYRKLNVLNEYLQFLLFQPKVYNNHREKFLEFTADKSTANISDQAMASYQTIENMAAQLYDSALIANVQSRSRHQEPT